MLGVDLLFSIIYCISQNEVLDEKNVEYRYGVQKNGEQSKGWEVIVVSFLAWQRQILASLTRAAQGFIP